MYFHVFKWHFCKEFDAQSAHVPNKGSQVTAASVIYLFFLQTLMLFRPNVDFLRNL